MNKIEFLENYPLVNLAVTTTLVYGITYAARTYVAINPAHVALLSVATCAIHNLSVHVLNRFYKDEDNLAHFRTLTGRITHYALTNLPWVLSVHLKIFSPSQALMAMGLLNVSYYLFETVAGCSPYDLLDA